MLKFAGVEKEPKRLRGAGRATRRRAGNLVVVRFAADAAAQHRASGTISVSFEERERRHSSAFLSVPEYSYLPIRPHRGVSSRAMDGDTPTGFIASLEATARDIRSGLDALWSNVVQVFFLPGDGLFALLVARAPALAARLGIGEEAFGGLYSALLSAACWIAALLVVLAGLRRMRDGLSALAGFARNGLLLAVHRQRMFRHRLLAPARRIGQSLRPRRSGFEEFQIDALQMAIMHAQAKLPPGHVITALDVAHEFRVGPRHAQRALDELKRLHLVEVSFGTTDGYAGYLLTRPGQVFLATCGRPATGATAGGRLRAR